VRLHDELSVVRPSKLHCEPTTHRLLPKGARPPPYYRSQCLREPTAAAWLGVGYSFNSLYGQRFSTRPLRYAVSHPRLVSTTSRRYRPRCRFPTRNAWISTVTVPAMLTRRMNVTCPSPTACPSVGTTTLHPSLCSP